ncbi:MAG TPA: hypothetical protein VGG34_01625 [Opitutaceae bacterium]|jgi:hypothetical protein
MDKTEISFWLTLVGTACWAACFWWMYVISRAQNRLLDRLSEQGRRIEGFSKVEHDLIREVHPQVGRIKDGMEAVVAAVTENTQAVAGRPRPKRGVSPRPSGCRSRGRSPGPSGAPAPAR